MEIVTFKTPRGRIGITPDGEVVCKDEEGCICIKNRDSSGEYCFHWIPVRDEYETVVKKLNISLGYHDACLGDLLGDGAEK
jgi:hypothetical protein